MKRKQRSKEKKSDDLSARSTDWARVQMNALLNSKNDNKQNLIDWFVLNKSWFVLDNWLLSRDTWWVIWWSFLISDDKSLIESLFSRQERKSWCYHLKQWYDANMNLSMMMCVLLMFFTEMLRLIYMRVLSFSKARALFSELLQGSRVYGTSRASRWFRWRFRWWFRWWLCWWSRLSRWWTRRVFIIFRSIFRSQSSVQSSYIDSKKSFNEEENLLFIIVEDYHLSVKCQDDV